MSNEFEQKKDVQQTSLGFIQTELNLARTFCKISNETDDPEKQRTRNIENANRAFQSALKTFRNLSEPGDDDWTNAKAALDEVERQLACLR